MKPMIERIDKNVSPNWHFADYHCDHSKDFVHCNWHYHNEIELVIYIDPHCVSAGKLIMDDYVGDITDQTAYLIGSGIPHMLTGSSIATKDKASSSHIMWLDQDWLHTVIDSVPALSSVSDLLLRAHKGLKLSPSTARQLFTLMNGACQLKPSAQFLRVIEILLLLSEDKNAKSLTSRPYCLYVAKDTPILDKLEKAQQFIAEHYNEAITVQHICRHLHMSESSVYRMFEKHFSNSCSEHLKRYRLGKASEMLIRSKTPVSVVSERVGFSNLSNFNRQFKAAKNMTPTAFRQLFG
ncbi:AraC-type DNA-binding protein [Enterovibrio nigricans DSM 22720]|uniref:AraC-type DNA-binding protein n=2 Tax=Enterovibrio nigricans TaxID=504469 RepID=A0A1T4U7D9_9GAMM|nr:AraC-type DNA-binding protein [Enterovibrio nigricans DSM 22720]